MKHQRKEILLKGDNHGQTPVHFALKSKTETVLSEILASLPNSESKLSVLSQTDYRRCPVLHAGCPWEENVRVFEAVVQNFTFSQNYHLFSATDKGQDNRQMRGTNIGKLWKALSIGMPVKERAWLLNMKSGHWRGESGLYAIANDLDSWMQLRDLEFPIVVPLIILAKHSYINNERMEMFKQLRDPCIPNCDSALLPCIERYFSTDSKAQLKPILDKLVETASKLGPVIHVYFHRRIGVYL